MVRAIILGLIQGLTEFLPVSSSGHLALAQKLMGGRPPDIHMEIFLHFGTLLALVGVYYRKLSTLLASSARAVVGKRRPGDAANLLFIGYLAIGTMPALFLGYFFHELIENLFDRVYTISILFLVTGIILFLTRFSRERRQKIGVLDSILVGFAQAFALLPGISRSGVTISTGIFRGMNKSEAADFAFLLAVPAILIISVYDFFRMSEVGLESLSHYLVGMVCAFVVGYAAVRLLLALVRKGGLSYFSFYCWFVGVASFILWTIRLKGGS